MIYYLLLPFICFAEWRRGRRERKQMISARRGPGSVGCRVVNREQFQARLEEAIKDAIAHRPSPRVCVKDEETKS